MKNQYLWLGASFGVFLIGRMMFSDLLLENVLIGGLMYIFIVWIIVVPYLTGEEMRIPASAFVLEKGKDNLYRLGFFSLGLYLCIKFIIY